MAPQFWSTINSRAEKGVGFLAPPNIWFNDGTSLVELHTRVGISVGIGWYFVGKYQPLQWASAETGIA
jgi:hypothetical protein